MIVITEKAEAKQGLYTVEEKTSQSIINHILGGKKAIFKDRILFNIIDERLNNEKIGYYIDTINMAIWI